MVATTHTPPGSTNSPEDLTNSDGPSTTEREQHVSASSPGSETSHRSRKRHKQEALAHQVQMYKLQQEIAAVQQRLDTLRRPSMNQALVVVNDCFEMKQRAVFLNRKLAEHTHWMQRINSLVESAPLFDFAVGMGIQQQPLGVGGGQPVDYSALNLQSLDEWREASKDEPLSQFILDERLKAAVAASRQNAAKLLYDATVGSPSLAFPLRSASRGWEIATGTLINDHLAFSCRRRLPDAMTSKAKELAMELWTSVQRDEVLRTFVPLVQDSVIARHGADYSLSRRMLQLAPDSAQQAVATVESISTLFDPEGRENAWQVSVEVVHDHYLCTFAADASGDFTVPSSSPPVKLDLGVQMSKLNMHNKFEMAIRVVKTSDSVDVLVVGSMRFDVPHSRDPAFDLLQHFVSYLPVYEDLHLAQYGNG
ncbi:hypothetical protein BBJ28_00015060 [Nothophytophthora sp. Chile5]|nr:hypothetical protein BBJ28_00015060 [Nothophytophthora sp. Chile5]